MRKFLSILILLSILLSNFAFACNPEVVKSIVNKNINSVCKISLCFIVQDYKTKEQLDEPYMISGSGYVKDCLPQPPRNQSILVIATALHVVDYETLIKQINEQGYGVLAVIIDIKFLDGSRLLQSVSDVKIKCDRETDYAEVTTYSDFQKPEVKISRTKLVYGDELIGITCPLGIPFVVTTGTVSLPEFKLDGRTFVLSDIELSPGSSGGAIFNDKGELVLLCKAIYAQTMVGWNPLMLEKPSTNLKDY